MNETQKAILSRIEEYLKENDGIRFTQALFNLGITEFADSKEPESKGYLLKDPYNDSDKRVLDRINLNCK